MCFCRSIRSLEHLHTLELSLSSWHENSTRFLFPLQDGGLTADSEWSALRVFKVGMEASQSQWAFTCVPPSGSLLTHVLCAARNLDVIEAKTVVFSDESIAPLLLHSSLPHLLKIDIDCSMTPNTAAQFGSALAGICLPCLHVIQVYFMKVKDQSRPGRPDMTQVHALRSFVHALSSGTLPAVSTLRLAAQGSKASKQSSHTAPPAAVEYRSHRTQYLQNSRVLGIALASMLRSTLRLQSLFLGSFDLSPASIRALAPCLKSLSCLETICFSDAEIGVEGATALCEHASGHESLASVALMRCRVHDDCVEPFWQWFKTLELLREIVLDGSVLGPMGVDMVDEIAIKLPKVEWKRTRDSVHMDAGLAASQTSASSDADDPCLKVHERCNPAEAPAGKVRHEHTFEDRSD